MVLDADGAEHPGISDQFVQLGAQVRTVQACRDQHPNVRRRDPGRSKVSINGRRNKWFGTGRVMSQIAIVALRAARAKLSNEVEPTDPERLF
jgi:hypothetical protein